MDWIGLPKLALLVWCLKSNDSTLWKREQNRYQHVFTSNAEWILFENACWPESVDLWPTCEIRIGRLVQLITWPVHQLSRKNSKHPRIVFKLLSSLKCLLPRPQAILVSAFFPVPGDPVAPATGWRVCVPRSPPAAPVRPGPRSPAPRWWRGCARHLDPRCHRLRRHMLGILGWLRCTYVICMYIYIYM